MFSAIGDHGKKPAPGMVIFMIFLKMRRQLANLLSQKGHLHLGRSSISLMSAASFCDDAFLTFCEHGGTIAQLTDNCKCCGNNFKISRLNLEVTLKS